MKVQKQWKALAPATKVRIVLMGLVQIALLAAALLDIRRRPATAIRGSKALWTGLVFINFVGPLSYFFFGRKEAMAPPVMQTAA
jgi:hypothetical protein